MAREKTIRKPINIELILNEQEELEVLRNSVDFNTFVFNEVLEAMKYAIKTKQPEAKVLNIVNFNHKNYLVCKEIDKLIKKL